MYAVEACLLNGLPDIFTPELVIGLMDDEITTIAGETRESAAEREQQEKKLKILEKTMITLRRLRKKVTTPNPGERAFISPIVMLTHLLTASKDDVGTQPSPMPASTGSEHKTK